MPFAGYRFFFALRPPRVVARRIDCFAESIAGGVKRLTLDHQHVTLALTEDFPVYPNALVARLKAAGAMVRAAPFDICFDQLSGGNRTVVLRPRRRIAPLCALIGAIEAAMRAAGAPMREGYAASPHQTLFYRKGTPFARPVQGFPWRAETFALIQSDLGLTRHTTLAQWPLTGGEAQLSFAGMEG